MPVCCVSGGGQFGMEGRGGDGCVEAGMIASFIEAGKPKLFYHQGSPLCRYVCMNKYTSIPFPVQHHFIFTFGF